MIEWQVLASHSCEPNMLPFSPYPKSGTPGELHGGVYGVPAMETWLAMGRPPTAICRPRVVLTIFKNE